ncbi:MAG: CBS domain-containing protein [Euryarchaeota archaeon]|nr:CBS domain-containing protein [Euryarchaeota archaeon]
MTRQVITLSPEESIEDAARKLRENRISGAPVVEGGRVVGVVSEADLMKLFESEMSINLVLPSPLEIIELPIRMHRQLKEAAKRIAARRVEDIMTRGVITIDEEAGIEEAARIMAKHGINRLPVIRQGRLVGIVTRADIIKAL